MLLPLSPNCDQCKSSGCCPAQLWRYFGIPPLTHIYIGGCATNVLRVPRCHHLFLFNMTMEQNVISANSKDQKTNMREFKYLPVANLCLHQKQFLISPTKLKRRNMYFESKPTSKLSTIMLNLIWACQTERDDLHYVQLFCFMIRMVQSGLFGLHNDILIKLVEMLLV